jgi:hypothetical protein
MIDPLEIQELIEETGISMVFRTYASESYDASTGKRTRGALISHNTKGLPPYKMSVTTAAERFGSVDGVKEAQFFSAVGASGLAFVPCVNQELVWDSQVWSLTAVNPIRDEAAVLLYEFGMKGKAD